MWTCFCRNTIVHVLFTWGGSSESHRLVAFPQEMSFSCNLLIRTLDQEIFASIKPCFRPCATRVQFVKARASIVDYLYAETILTMFNKLLVFLLSVRNNKTISLLWKCCRRIEQVFTWRPQVKFAFFSFQLHIPLHIIFGRFESLSNRINKKRLHSLMTIIYTFFSFYKWNA